MLAANIDTGPRLRRWAAIGALEIAFWTPLCAVPIAAKLHVGEQIVRGDVLACVIVSGLLAAIGSYCGRFQAVYRLILFPILALGSLIVTGMALSKQGFLNPFVMLAIIDTNPEESTEFVSRFGAADIAMAALLLIPLIPLAVQIRRRLFPPPSRYPAIALAGLLAAHLGLKAVHNAAKAAQENQPDPSSWQVARLGQQASNYPVSYMPFQPYIALASAIATRWEIDALAKQAKPVPGVATIEPANGRRTYVVIVGEALSKYHMHLYGYGRDTTPELDRLAGDGEVRVFRDVVTSHAMTVPALTTAFRFQPGRGQDGHTLFDVLNGGGFKTWWISNQYQYGVYESGVSLLTSATTQRWLSQALVGGVYAERRDFDSDLLPELRKVLARDDGDRFIFLHLMGSHDAYRARYPKSAEHFTTTPASCLTAEQARAVNEYDNSVRFNDTIVRQILEAVRAASGTSGDAFVLYFSDHGEEVYEFRDFAGHNDSMVSPYLADVPFMVWLSDGYKERHPGLVGRLAEAADRPYDTGELLYSIADLARLSFRGMDSTRSIFSAEFTPRKRLTADRDYDQLKHEWAPDAAHARPASLIPCHGTATAALENARRGAIGPR